MNVEHPPDLALGRIAARQHGVVTVAQLSALGLNAHAVSYRVEVGRLHALHRGVYAVGHCRVSWHAASLAAALSVGGDAVVSHWTAATLWGLLDTHPGPPDVTVARRVRARRAIHVDTARGLDRRDRTIEHGVPVTTVARTLLDLADVADDKALKRTLGAALVQRRIDERAVRAQLAAASGRHGAGRLAALIERGASPTRSALEDRVLELLASHGLPAPQVNARLVGLPRRVEVDFLYVDAGLIIEADGARYHDNRATRDADASRQAMLEAAGFRVLRVTWRQVTERGEQTVLRVRRALATGGQARRRAKAGRARLREPL